MSKVKGKEFWGSPCWSWEHIIAHELKPQARRCYIKQWHILSELLPCDVCQENLKSKLNAIDVERYVVQGAKGAFLLTYTIHDLANKHITKYTSSTKISPPYSDVVRTYSDELSRGYRFWGQYMWCTIHSIAVTVTAKNGALYISFLKCCAVLMPMYGEIFTALLKQYPPEPYMGNNKDAFFYSHLLHKKFDEYLGITDTPTHSQLQELYFRSLSEECAACRLE